MNPSRAPSDHPQTQAPPADANGYHSLIPVNHLGTCALPPLATVTLEKVQAPGEWVAVNPPGRSPVRTPLASRGARGTELL